MIKKIKDEATREMLVDLFNKLDDKKEYVVNKAVELANDIQSENRFYVKKN